MANVERSIVGDLINFRGLVYAPQTESAVLFLFGKVAEDLNMFVEEMRPEAPDAIVRRFTGKGWERLRVEFEQRSSDFQRPPFLCLGQYLRPRQFRLRRLRQSHGFGGRPLGCRAYQEGWHVPNRSRRPDAGYRKGHF